MSKKILKVAMLFILGVFILGTSLPVMANVTSDTGTADRGSGLGMRAQTMVKALSDLTGMDINDIRAERQAGKSVLDIAQDKGIEEQVLKDKVTATNKARLQKMLNQGTITQDQYDTCIKQMEQRIEERLDRKDVGGYGMAQGRGAGNKAGRGQGLGCGRGPGNGYCLQINN